MRSGRPNGESTRTRLSRIQTASTGGVRVGIRSLASCESAWGPDADRRAKRLIFLAMMGSTLEAYSHHVADMTLLDDSFSALRPAFHEGKRVVTGIRSAMCLPLTRDSLATLIIIAVSILGLGFPFEPAQVALTYLAAGIPSFF